MQLTNTSNMNTTTIQQTVLCATIALSAVASLWSCNPELQAELGQPFNQVDVMIVVWDLDRAWRSAKDALNELHNMRARGIEVQIASMSLDTGTPIGKLMFTFISGLAEFERELHITRTREGLQAARKRGTRDGGSCSESAGVS